MNDCGILCMQLCDAMSRKKQRGNGLLLLTRAWKICYSYWPMSSSSKRSKYSNRGVTTQIIQSLYA